MNGMARAKILQMSAMPMFNNRTAHFSILHWL